MTTVDNAEVSTNPLDEALVDSEVEEADPDSLAVIQAAIAALPDSYDLQTEGEVKRVLPRSIFFKTKQRVYAHRWAGKVYVGRIVGGTPANPRVIEGWLKKSLGASNPELMADMVAQTMIEQRMTKAAAVEELQSKLKTNRFKRLRENGELYLESRCLKAAMKEAANIRWPKARWGDTSMGTMKLIAEHLFVAPEELSFSRTVPDGTQQRFVKTWRGTGIAYEEFCDGVELKFEVYSDFDFDNIKTTGGKFTKNFWSELWVTSEEQGLGSVRSQGFGKFAMMEWDKIS